MKTSSEAPSSNRTSSAAPPARPSSRATGLEYLISDRTRSDLEILFLSICRRYAIPLPEVNVKLGRWEVDFLWRDERLVVETDFWGYHRGSIAFEDDHARDLDLRAAGYAVLRYDDTQLESEPGRVAEDVSRGLSRARVA